MSEQDIAYGGQAVIGGVMIQSPKGWSLGIRDKNNKLHKYYEERIPLSSPKNCSSCSSETEPLVSMQTSAVTDSLIRYSK